MGQFLKDETWTQEQVQEAEARPQGGSSEDQGFNSPQ